MSPQLSILIPAYNEEHRIIPYLEEIDKYTKSKNLNAEIIVVDDGSSDQTIAVVNEFKKNTVRDRYSFKIIQQKINQGKGAAIIRGANEAQGKLLLFTDADGSSPISELEKLLPFSDTHNIIFGSRALGGELKAKFYRKALGRFFNFFVSNLLFPNIKDTQCGFKLMDLKSSLAILNQIKETGFSFDLELLYLAKINGLSFKEVPIAWHHVDGSKVSVIRDGIKMLFSIFLIRFRHGSS